MDLTVAEKIKLVCGRAGITLAELAEKTGQSRQNLSNKLSRDNFSANELLAIAEVVGCKLDIVFTLPDGRTI